jgi:hypothetical protein
MLWRVYSTTILQGKTKNQCPPCYRTTTDNHLTRGLRTVELVKSFPCKRPASVYIKFLFS